MNEQERQALREKHVYDDYGCQICVSDGTCDVIKRLDATENLKSSDLKTGVECDHLAGRWVPVTLLDKSWPYCPKCGEKL